MAPLEAIWPSGMHTPPTPVGAAVMWLCGVTPLTSGVGLIAAAYWRKNQREIETLDDLSDAAAEFGVNPTLRFTPRQQ